MFNPTHPSEMSKVLKIQTKIDAFEAEVASTKAKIASTETELADAISVGDVGAIAYSRNRLVQLENLHVQLETRLVELQKKENILLTREGKLSILNFYWLILCC